MFFSLCCFSRGSSRVHYRRLLVDPISSECCTCQGEDCLDFARDGLHPWVVVVAAVLVECERVVLVLVMMVVMVLVVWWPVMRLLVLVPAHLV